MSYEYDIFFMISMNLILCIMKLKSLLRHKVHALNYF